MLGGEKTRKQEQRGPGSKASVACAWVGVGSKLGALYQSVRARGWGWEQGIYRPQVGLDRARRHQVSAATIPAINAQGNTSPFLSP